MYGLFWTIWCTRCKLYRCHICDGEIRSIPKCEKLPQVTSDCKPWGKKARIVQCLRCGCIQKAIDREWHDDVKKIYNEYQIYHQSGGVEQPVFDNATGAASSRSARLIEYVHSKIELPKKGNMLDVGCGNGGLLRTFNNLVQGWKLAGTELDDKYRDDIEGIGENTALFTCDLGSISDKYSLITMLHVLEHVVNPILFLKTARDKLADGGFLVVDLPDFRQNPFDLMIADHCTHFDLNTLIRVLKNAGFETFAATSAWVPKEISLIAEKAKIEKDSSNCDEQENLDDRLQSVVNCLEWMESFRVAAEMVSGKGHFGVFGTSIAAGWLFGAIDGAVDFFVDEDSSRTGKTFLGKPIYSTQTVPDDSHVFIALPTGIAENIYSRLTGGTAKYYLPPPMAVIKH